MTYDGSLVRLRAMSPDDAPAQHRWFNDPEVTRFTALRYPASEAAIAARLDGAAAMTFANPRFAVERRDTGELIGYTALRDATPESRNAELDLMIGERAVWGQGFGTDTTRTVCRFGFEQLGLHRVHLWVFAEHVAAIRAYERVGFVHEGRARDRFFQGGRWHDCLLMGLLADEWSWPAREH
jgi:RimJ/RimL family protein N-acetyltransferase